MNARTPILLLVLVLSLAPSATARILLIPSPIIFQNGNLTIIGGNISQLAGGSGVTITNPFGPVPSIGVDTTVCRANGTNCPASGSGSGNMSLWRIGADTGVNANVTNNTLIRILSGPGVSTMISGLDVFITSTITQYTDAMAVSAAAIGLQNSTICRSDGTNCPSFSSGNNGLTEYDAPQCDTNCVTSYEVIGT